jgi:hypothetical protein
MTSIRKQIQVSANPHFVEVNSSLDLEEVEITGTDPISGKTVHISLSSLLKQPRYPEPTPVYPQPVQTPSLLNVGASSPSPDTTWMSLPSPSIGGEAAGAPWARGPTTASLSASATASANVPPPYSLPASYSAPPAMDMFSDPLPTITPPLSNEVTTSPAPAVPESGLQGLAGISQTPSWSEQTVSPMPAPSSLTPSQGFSAPTPEVIQAREPQGLEALDDPLPSMGMESAHDEVVVEGIPTHRPTLKRADGLPNVDDTLASMYRH